MLTCVKCTMRAESDNVQGDWRCSKCVTIDRNYDDVMCIECCDQYHGGDEKYIFVGYERPLSAVPIDVYAEADMIAPMLKVNNNVI